MRGRSQEEGGSQEGEGRCQKESQGRQEALGVAPLLLPLVMAVSMDQLDVLLDVARGSLFSVEL